MLTLALSALMVCGVAAASRAQLPLGGEFQINTSVAGYQWFPAVATRSSGDFVVVWEHWAVGDRGHLTPDIRGQRFDRFGNPVGGESTVNTSTARWQFAPSITVNPDGSSVVVWRSDHMPPDGLFGQRFDPSGGALGSEFQIASAQFMYYGSNRLGLDSADNGDFVVVWPNRDASSHGVAGRRYDSSGSPLGEEFQVNSYMTDSQSEAQVAAGPDGDFVVVWSSFGQDGDGSGVFAQRFDASGGRVGSEFQVNSYVTGFQSEPALDIGADGELVVVWSSSEQDGSGWGIFGQRYDADGSPAGDEFRVNSRTTGSQSQPSVTVANQGSFVVSWQGPFSDGSYDDDILAREFAADGTPTTEDFRVNSLTRGNQGVPRIAADEDGDYVVVWNGAYVEGSGYEVFGQRYARPGSGPVLSLSGSCPGPIIASLANVTPNTEVGLVAAGNTNGSTKGGTLCPGTRFEIGEPFAMPVIWVFVDGEGRGETTLQLAPNQCFVQALATATCETSNTARAPSAEERR